MFPRRANLIDSHISCCSMLATTPSSSPTPLSYVGEMCCYFRAGAAWYVMYALLIHVRMYMYIRTN
jgi:hypothetical protein